MRHNKTTGMRYSETRYGRKKKLNLCSIWHLFARNKGERERESEREGEKKHPVTSILPAITFAAFLFFPFFISSSFFFFNPEVETVENLFPSWHLPSRRRAAVCDDVQRRHERRTLSLRASLLSGWVGAATIQQMTSFTLVARELVPAALASPFREAVSLSRACAIISARHSRAGHRGGR